MGTKALVIVENNIPLADSRYIAEKLGIEEDFGFLRFENGKTLPV